jgi:hypothetical protein
MTTETLTLSAFLLARIEEDEAGAQMRAIVESCRPRYAILYRESERLLATAFDQESVRVEGASGPIWPHDGAETTLRALASVYADHEDYLAEWAL